jgi:Site-specific recombinase XerD
MSQPVIVSNGTHEIKIYTVANRDKQVFQLSYYEGGTRQRKTFAKLSDARQEAKVTLGRLALTGREVGELGIADLESYAVARRHVEPTGVPLHVCAEVFAAAYKILAGTPLLDAVKFYRDFHPLGIEVKTVSQLIESFADCREKMGVSSDHVENIRHQLGRMTKSFPGKGIVGYRTAELDSWLSRQSWKPATKNNVRKILISFGNWLKKNGYLPPDRPTEFDGMMLYKEPPTKVEIYTPKELAELLMLVKEKRPKLLPWVVCAAFIGARVSELKNLDWKQINFERGFVEVASKKVRTKARRLVPLHNALRAWLAPYRQESGPINVYAAPRTILTQLAKEAGLAVRKNGFRHSYISYRLAVINDTARVALEAGNSADIIFQHYRELVTPEEAKAWFSTMPEESKPAPTPETEETTSLPMAA